MAPRYSLQNGTLFIGQLRSHMNNGFDWKQSYRGLLTELEIFDSSRIRPSDVMCNHTVLHSSGQIFSWHNRSTGNFVIDAGSESVEPGIVTVRIRRVFVSQCGHSDQAVSIVYTSTTEMPSIATRPHRNSRNLTLRFILLPPGTIIPAPASEKALRTTTESIISTTAQKLDKETTRKTPRSMDNISSIRPSHQESISTTLPPFKTSTHAPFRKTQTTSHLSSIQQTHAQTPVNTTLSKLATQESSSSTTYSSAEYLTFYLDHRTNNVTMVYPEKVNTLDSNVLAPTATVVTQTTELSLSGIATQVLQNISQNQDASTLEYVSQEHSTVSSSVSSNPTSSDPQEPCRCSCPCEQSQTTVKRYEPSNEKDSKLSSINIVRPTTKSQNYSYDSVSKVPSVGSYSTNSTNVTEDRNNRTRREFIPKPKEPGDEEITPVIPPVKRTPTEAPGAQWFAAIGVSFVSLMVIAIMISDYPYFLKWGKMLRKNWRACSRCDLLRNPTPRDMYIRRIRNAVKKASIAPLLHSPRRSLAASDFSMIDLSDPDHVDAHSIHSTDFL